jgi:hypothetical protein
LTLEDLELHRLDLVVVVLVERHPGVAPLTSGKRATKCGSEGKGRKVRANCSVCELKMEQGVVMGS